MLKKILIPFLLILSLKGTAQEVYENLKKKYTAQYIYEQGQGDAFRFIKDEINRTDGAELKQWATAAIVGNVYGYGLVDDKKLLFLLDNVIAKPQSEHVKRIAGEVKAEVTRSLVNTKITSINLPSMGKDSLNLMDYYSSKFDYVVVDLWATWCGPCIAEMKKFNDLRKQYNVEFYSISLDDDISKVQRFAKRNPGYTWPIVFAGKHSSLGDYFKARLIPAFVIVDKNGMIISHIVGKGLEEELKKLYKK